MYDNYFVMKCCLELGLLFQFLLYNTVRQMFI